MGMCTCLGIALPPASCPHYGTPEFADVVGCDKKTWPRCLNLAWVVDCPQRVRTTALGLRVQGMSLSIAWTVLLALTFVSLFNGIFLLELKGSH